MTVSLDPDVQYGSRPVLTFPDAETPKGSLVLPRDWKQEGEASVQHLVDNDLVGQMQSQRVLQQGPGFAALLPFRAPADFNCLPHSVAIAMRGYEDKDRQLRALIRRNMEGCCPAAPYFRAQWTNAILHLDRKAFGQEVERSKSEWQHEWETEMQLVADDRSSLTEIHVFILAHVVRRPIIVYCPAFVKDQNGKDLAPIHFGGLYLPLLLPAEDCSSASPVLLLYLNSHFSPLVPVEPEDGEPLVAPLADSDGAYLPIHFVDQDAFAPGGVAWRELLDRYLQVHHDTALPCDGAVLEAGDRCTMPLGGEAELSQEISILLPPIEPSLNASEQTPRSTASRTSSIGHSCASSSDLAARSVPASPAYPPAMRAEAARAAFPQRSMSPRPGQLALDAFPKAAVRSKSCVTMSSSMASPIRHRSAAPAPQADPSEDPLGPRTFVRPSSVSKAQSPAVREGVASAGQWASNLLSPASPASPQSSRPAPEAQCRTQRAISLAATVIPRSSGTSQPLSSRRGTFAAWPLRAEPGSPAGAAGQRAGPGPRGALSPGPVEAERPLEVAYCPASPSTSLNPNRSLASPSCATRRSASPASSLLPPPQSVRALPAGPSLAPAGSPSPLGPGSPRAKSPTLALCDPYGSPTQRAVPRSPTVAPRTPAPREDGLNCQSPLGRVRSRAPALAGPPTPASPVPSDQKLLRPHTDSSITSRLTAQSPMTSRA